MKMNLRSTLTVALALLGLTLVNTPLRLRAESLSIPAATGAETAKTVVLLAGDEEYRSEEALPMLAKLLSQKHGFNCHVLFSVGANGEIDPTKTGSLTNPELLDKADVIVMSLRFRNWPDAAMEKFEAALNRGVPFVALRTSTHAFNFKGNSSWAKYAYNAKDPWKGGFGREVLGETWVAHHGAHKKEGCRGIVESGAENSPLLRGVKDVFVGSDVYTANPPTDVQVLMRGEVTTTLEPNSPAVEGKKNDPKQPIVWSRSYSNGAGKTNKVFTTTMGAASDLANEGLRRLVVNAVYWAADRDVPAEADVAFVDPFVPTFYGFGGYVKGLKADDLGLGKPFPPAK